MTEKLIKIIIGILFIGIFFYIGTRISNVESKLVKATILEHSVIGDRHGNRTYITIVKTDDGYVQELTGLVHYSKPIGSTFTLKVWRDETNNH